MQILLLVYDNSNEMLSNARIPNGVTTGNSTSSKYKSSLLEESTADGANRKLKDVKIVAPLKYLSHFLRSSKNSIN